MLFTAKTKNTLMNLTPTQIANKIKEISGIDLFKNTRKKEYIELRALLGHLLRNKLNMRWRYIAQFYIDNGKKYDHSLAIHSCRTYKELAKHNPKLKEMENMFTFKSNLNYDQIDKCYYLENKVNNLNNKITKLKGKLNSPAYNLLKDVDDKDVPELQERLLMWKKSLQWKKKLK